MTVLEILLRVLGVALRVLGVALVLMLIWRTGQISRDLDNLRGHYERIGRMLDERDARERCPACDELTTLIGIAGHLRRWCMRCQAYRDDYFGRKPPQ